MTAPALREVLARAIALGLLPSEATDAPAEEPRPWPVLLLTALGAWLAAVPLLLFLGLWLGSLFRTGLGPYLAGAPALALALAILRAKRSSPFVEQLALPALLVGFGALGYGLGRDLPDAAAAALLAVLALACSRLIERSWLRVLLGAVSAGLLTLALAAGQVLRPADMSPTRLWASVHVVLAAWVAATWAQAHRIGFRHGAWIESVGCGWVLAVIAMLAWLSGMTFLAGASTGLRGAGQGLMHGFAAAPGQRAFSAALALLGCALWAWRWSSLRKPGTALAAAVLAALGAFMPTLGALILLLALCATTHRLKRAAAAALACVWVIGAFYYPLQWPLATKALVLALAGALLGVAARLMRATAAHRALPRSAAAADRTWQRWLMPLGAIVTVGISIASVARNERLITEGRPAFVELAPVDPRSLMQGDHMQLAYAMPPELRARLERLQTTQRPLLAATRDPRDVLTPVRLVDSASALAPGEELIELSPKDGRWVIVSDAWFFKEGEAKRWEGAKFAEFRLLPDGRALLVGLRGAALQPL